MREQEKERYSDILYICKIKQTDMLIYIYNMFCVAGGAGTGWRLTP